MVIEPVNLAPSNTIPALTYAEVAKKRLPASSSCQHFTVYGGSTAGNPLRHNPCLMRESNNDWNNTPYHTSSPLGTVEETPEQPLLVRQPSYNLQEVVKHAQSRKQKTLEDNKHNLELPEAKSDLIIAKKNVNDENTDINTQATTEARSSGKDHDPSNSSTRRSSASKRQAKHRRPNGISFTVRKIDESEESFSNFIPIPYNLRTRQWCGSTCDWALISGPNPYNPAKCPTLILTDPDETTYYLKPKGGVSLDDGWTSSRLGRELHMESFKRPQSTGEGWDLCVQLPWDEVVRGNQPGAAPMLTVTDPEGTTKFIYHFGDNNILRSWAISQLPELQPANPFTKW